MPSSTNEDQTEPQAGDFRIVLTLASGSIVQSDPMTVHKTEAEGPTLADLMKLCETFTTRDTFQIPLNGSAMWFNPAHIMSLQIVTANDGVRPVRTPQ